MPCQDATSSLPAGAGAAREDGGDLRGYRSLLECLEDVPEPRRRRGIRHRLAVVLAFAVAAVLALGITSRSPERGGTPEVIATAARGHWDIEALHHVRDTTLDEDAPAAPFRIIRPGHGGHPQRSHSNPPAGRLHLSRCRAPLGRTQPRQARRRLESHNLRMTTALGVGRKPLRSTVP